MFENFRPVGFIFIFLVIAIWVYYRLVLSRKRKGKGGTAASCGGVSLRSGGKSGSMVRPLGKDGVSGCRPRIPGGRSTTAI